MTSTEFQATPPSPSNRALGVIYSVAGFFWAHVWQIFCILLVAAFTYFVIDPFGKKPDLQAEDIAAAWTGSIEKLGILAIFPPEEDFHVGDIWAIVADTDSATPLLGRAVRLDHLDLREEILAGIRNQTAVFADTADVKPGEKFRKQDPGEIVLAADADKKIALTLASFPGITINHSVRASSALTDGLLGFNASRQEQEIEEISIPVAETYGAGAAAAYDRLILWCTTAPTKSKCTDAYARSLLAFAVDSRVTATGDDGAYTNPIQLRLITRVFLTREIRQKRRQTSSRGASGSISAQSITAAATTPDSSSAGPQANGAGDVVVRTENTTTGVRGANMSTFRGDGLNIELRETFQRPVAFGYRAITLILPSTKPQ